MSVFKLMLQFLKVTFSVFVGLKGLNTVLFCSCQQQIYGYEDLQMLQSRLPMVSICHQIHIVFSFDIII